MPTIVIVGLDIKSTQDEFDAYDALSAQDKLSRITYRIHSLCAELKETEPDSIWIIAWREYGIFEPESNSISNVIRDQFKKEMKAIVNLYSNLILVPGTISTYKTFQDRHKLSSLKEYYKELEPLQKLEERPQIEQHKTDVLNLESLNQTENELTVVRNTAYVFYHDVMLRHDKLMPYNELEFLEVQDAIFQPGKGMNRSTVLRDLSLPKFTPFHFNMGIEICREHGFGILKKELLQTRVKPPLLHFILSASVDVRKQDVCGDYVIHLDSKEKIAIYQTTDSEEIEVKLYQNDLLADKVTLEGPIKPIWVPPPFPDKEIVMIFFKKIISVFDNVQERKLSIDRFLEVLSNAHEVQNLSCNVDLYAILSDDIPADQIKALLLQFAIEIDDKATIQQLLKQGANPYLSLDGLSAESVLLSTISQQNEKILKLLIVNNIDFSKPLKVLTNELLIYAEECRSDQSVALLLKKQHQSGLPSYINSWTALDLCVFFNNEKTVSMLLEKMYRSNDLTKEKLQRLQTIATAMNHQKLQKIIIHYTSKIQNIKKIQVPAGNYEKAPPSHLSFRLHSNALSINTQEFSEKKRKRGNEDQFLEQGPKKAKK